MNTTESVSDHVVQTRRGFLATAAAAAGVGGLIASAGAARPIPAALAGIDLKEGETINLGVIGTGGMGTGHCAAICDLVKAGKENAKIVAVADCCDIHAENAKKTIEDPNRQGPNTVQAYRDYKELLARKDIHAVVIASPEHWHAQHAEDAILAGKDVYCEKPMTLDLAMGVRLREVVLKNPQRVFQVGTQMMQLPKYKAAREMIASGAIGHATMSQTSYCRNSKDGEWNYYALNENWKPGVNLDWDAWCGPLGKAAWDPLVYARWRRYKKYSTGIIGDLLVHVMTPLIFALDAGWPTYVTATGGHYIDKKMENCDQVNLTVQFEKEHTMIIAGSTCNEVGLDTMIRGNKGNLYLGDRHCTFRPERIYSEDSEEKKVECPDIGNDQDVHRLNWLGCIRSRNAPDAGVDISMKVIVAVDLATRAIWQGGAYRFDPKTMTASKC